MVNQLDQGFGVLHAGIDDNDLARCLIAVIPVLRRITGLSGNWVGIGNSPFVLRKLYKL